MSLINEITVRPIGSELFLVAGDWDGAPVLGLGFGNHPEIILRRDHLLLATWAGHGDTDEVGASDRLLTRLLIRTMDALKMPAEAGYAFVASCKEAGFVPTGESSLADWIVLQLQTAAGHPEAPEAISAT